MTAADGHHPYTDEFFTITRKGHDRTTQSFGTPTLTWHVGIWPKADPGRGAADEADAHNADVRRLRDHLNAVVVKLQERGRHPTRTGTAPDRFEVERDADGEPEHLQKESINFTLWWADDAAGPPGPPGPPGPGDLRVRVQVEVYPDFAAVTFFLDAGKRWGELAPARDGDGAAGGRRREVFRHVARVTRVCEGRVRGGRMDLDPLAGEAGVTDDDRRDLLAAARYLYSDRASDDAGEGGIWEEFGRAFGVGLADLAGDGFEVFVNLRGLVLATAGRPADPPPPPTADGGPRFERFRPEDPAAADGRASDEPNAVVHGYWPFVRRTRAEADARDWIACGVLGWRALFVSALGAQSQYAAGDEEAVERLPADLPGRLVSATSTAPGRDLPAPFRYLLLTKGEPHRRQIGRMVDRVHTLSTLQLYSFKNWGVLRTANVLVRAYGRRLDGVLEDWVERSERINRNRGREVVEAVGRQAEAFADAARSAAEADRAAVPAGLLARPPAGADGARLLVERMRALGELREGLERRPRPPADLLALGHASWAELRRLKSRRDEDAALVNQEAERELIAISRALDDLGRRAVGGIAYRINRSRYYADTYRAVLKSMRCGNIETWWTYDQFADRSVEPVFRFVAGIGERLDKLRGRLVSTMESIQTSAIVNQTEATRDNTYQMESIARNLEKLLSEAEQARAGAERRGRRLVLLGWAGVAVLGLFGVGTMAPLFSRLRGWLGF